MRRTYMRRETPETLHGVNNSTCRKLEHLHTQRRLMVVIGRLLRDFLGQITRSQYHASAISFCAANGQFDLKMQITSS
jgi:hypothetical protein